MNSGNFLRNLYFSIVEPKLIRMRAILVLIFSFMLFTCFGFVNPVNAFDPPSGVEEVQKAEDVEIVKTSSKYNETLEGYKIFCQVKNNSASLIKFVTVKATFYNDDGKIVGTGVGNATNISSNEESTITILASNVTNASEYDVKVSNVMRE